MSGLCRLVAASLIWLGLAGAALAQGGYAVGIQPSAEQGVVPVSITFGLTIFTERGGRIASARLDYGDGSAPITIRPNDPRPQRHTYTEPSTFRAVLTIVTADGQELDSGATITIRPARQPDPATLIRATPALGVAPLSTTLSWSADGIGFDVTEVLVATGDGQRQVFRDATELAHVYEQQGDYQATILFRGAFGNVARGTTTVRVIEAPVATLVVSPGLGIAPLVVEAGTVLPTPETRARLLLDGAVVAEGAGTTRHVLEQPGFHTFELVVATAAGPVVADSASVAVLGDDLTGLYAHDGGLVAIGGGGGEFTGVLEAATPAQVGSNYTAGTALVDGVYAEVARSLAIAPPPDNEGLAGTTINLPTPEQVTHGRYLVRQGSDCPEQWGDYSFAIDYGAPDAGRPTTITGMVRYARAMPRFIRAFQRLDEPVPFGGMAGQVDYVRALIDAVGRAGDTGHPQDCVLDDQPRDVRAAGFTRIDEAAALALVQGLREQFDERVRALLAMAEGDAALPDGERLDPAWGQPVASAEPVLLHNGEYFLTRLDLVQDGGPLPWTFQRVYRSRSNAATSLGHGWTHDAMFALQQESETWMFRTARGGARGLDPNGLGDFWEGSNGERLTIEGDERVLHDVDGTRYRFEPLPGNIGRSRIVSVADANGNVTGYETDFLGRVTAATDPLGRRAEYRYDATTGLLAEVAAADGRRLVFIHDDDGDLAEAHLYAAGAEQAAWTERYAYDAEHNLTGLWLTQDKGPPDVEIAYDDADRVASQRDGNAVETFAYGARETIVTAPGRATERHRFDANDMPAAKTYILADGREITIAREFDRNGRLVAETMPLGNGRRITRDEAGHPIEVRHIGAPGSGLEDRVYLMAYEPRLHRLQALWGPFAGDPPPDEAGRDAMLVVHYDYDEAGNSVRVTVPAEPFADGTTRGLLETRQEFDDAGRPVRVERPGQPPLVHRYADGLLSEIVELRADGTERRLARFDHDKLGRVVGQADFNGGYTGIVYDGLGDPVLSVPQDPGIAGLARTFAGHGSLVTLDAVLGDDPAQHLGEWSYDRRGNLILERRFADDDTVLERALEYDDYGRLAALTEDRQRTEYVHDQLGRLTAARILGDGVAVAEMAWAYNDNGQLVEEHGPDGGTARYAYDGFDRLVAVEGPDGRRAERTLDLHGRVVEQRIIEDGEVVASEGTVYAGFGGAVEAWTAEADGVRMTVGRVERDPNGRMLSYEADGARLAYRYGADGRLLGIDEGDAFTVDFGYDAAGRLVETVTSGADQLPTRELRRYDDWGRLVEVTQPDLWRETYARDPLGNVVAATSYTRDRAGFRQSLAFDRLGRPLSLVEERQGETALALGYEWDGRFGPSAITVDGREMARFGYDALGSLAMRAELGGPELAFTSAPNETTMVDGRGVRHTVTQAADGVLTISHDDQLERLVLDATGRAVEHERDGWGYVETAGEDRLRREAGGYVIEDVWTEQGATRRRTMPSGLAYEVQESGDDSAVLRLPDGATVTLIYPVGGRLAVISMGPVEIRSSIDLARDQGHVIVSTRAEAAELVLSTHLDGAVVTSVSENDGAGLSVERDDTGRIVGGNVDDAGFAIGYDAVGNRARIERDGVVTEAVHDGFRCVTIGGQACAHDGDGRLTALGDDSFTYDAAGWLVGVDGPGRSIRYRRDAIGRVVERQAGAEIRHFVWDDYGLAAEIVDGAVAVEYLRDRRGNLVGLATPDAFYLAMVGPDGSLRAVIAGDGTVVERYRYGPFGETTVVRGERPLASALFHGMLWDPEAGLYLAPARSYWPELGRFLEPDPAGLEAAWHPYSYALDDPLTFTDPLGAEPRDNDINEIIRDGANNPQDASWLVRFGLWLHGLFDASTDGLDAVGDAIERGEMDHGRMGQIESRIAAAMPAKASAYTADEIYDRLSANLMNQMAWETFGPAVIGGGLEILARGGRLLPGALRRAGQRLRQAFGRNSGVDDWAEHALSRQAREAAEFDRVAALSPFEPLAWAPPLRREVDEYLDDAARAAGITDIGRYVDEVRWVDGRIGSNYPSFGVRLVPGGPDGAGRIWRTLELPDTLRLIGPSGGEFAARAGRLRTAGHELAHAEEFYRRLVQRFGGDQAAAVAEFRDITRVRGARYAIEEVAVEGRALNRLMSYLGPDRVRSLAPEVVDDSIDYLRTWRERIMRYARQGRM